jgi:hypothetical protein
MPCKPEIDLVTDPEKGVHTKFTPNLRAASPIETPCSQTPLS